jgi:hypothetical protein
MKFYSQLITEWIYMLAKIKQLFATIKRLLATKPNVAKDAKLSPTNNNIATISGLVVVALIITIMYVFASTYVGKVLPESENIAKLDSNQNVDNPPLFDQSDSLKIYADLGRGEIRPDELEENPEEEPKIELPSSNWAETSDQAYTILDSWRRLLGMFDSKFPSDTPPIDMLGDYNSKFGQPYPPENHPEPEYYPPPIRENVSWHELANKMLDMENKLADAMKKATPPGELPYPELEPPEPESYPEPPEPEPKPIASWQDSAQKFLLLEQELANIMHKFTLDGINK